jgi:hypothetical protein
MKAWRNESKAALKWILKCISLYSLKRFFYFSLYLSNYYYVSFRNPFILSYFHSSPIILTLLIRNMNHISRTNEPRSVPSCSFLVRAIFWNHPVSQSSVFKLYTETIYMSANCRQNISVTLAISANLATSFCL